MTETLEQFLRSPGGCALPVEPPRRRVSRSKPIAREVAAVLGVDADEVTRRGEMPLDRPVTVAMADATPGTMRSESIAVEGVSISATRVTFRHRDDFSMRRLIVEIDGEAARSMSRPGRFVGNVVRTYRTADGYVHTTVRLHAVVV